MPSDDSLTEMGAKQAMSDLFSKTTQRLPHTSLMLSSEVLGWVTFYLAFRFHTHVRGKKKEEKGRRENDGASTAAKATKKKRKAASVAWTGSSSGLKARVTTQRRSGGRWPASWSRRWRRHSLHSPGRTARASAERRGEVCASRVHSFGGFRWSVDSVYALSPAALLGPVLSTTPCFELALTT